MRASEDFTIEMVVKGKVMGWRKFIPKKKCSEENFRCCLKVIFACECECECE